MQTPNVIGYVPRYNMSLGLGQMRSLSSESQIKFYQMYFSQMRDLGIYMVVLKKILYRMGSLGAITDSSLQSVINDMEAYERDFLPPHNEFRYVEFYVHTGKVITTPQKMVNLLGIQGDNCQATFNHRFIMGSRDPLMLATVALMALDALQGEPFLSSHAAGVLRKQIKEFKSALSIELA